MGFFLFWLWLGSAVARADSQLPLDPSQFADLNQLLSPTITNGFVTTVGLLSAHRPYEPATGLGTSFGVDIGIEVTLVKIPKAFNDALAAAGTSQSLSDIPSIPVPKISIHKGDLGFSGVQYLNYKIYGGDVKLVVSNPTEGPTWALRFNYTWSAIGFVFAKTYEPQLLISRKLDFADPYIGFGYQVVRGKISADINFADGIPSQHIEGSGGGTAAQFLCGLSMRIPGLGVRLTMEGAYNSAGASTLGTKVGVSF